MVAFAGHKYAARSTAAFVANSTYTVTSFTLVSKDITIGIKDLNLIMSFVVCGLDYLVNVFLYICRCLSSPRAGCRTCTGKEMGAPNVQGTPALFASTTRTVQSRLTAASPTEALLIAASGSNWRFQGRISTFQF